MKLSEFDYDLPERLIAVRPAEPRSSARLLVARGDTIADRSVLDLPEELRRGDRLVLNDTRVIPARLTGHRATPGGARIEATLLNPTPDGNWRALIKPLRKWREGETVDFGAGLVARMLGREENAAILKFNLEGDHFDAAVAEAGAMPLPPYIEARRSADERDRTDYQTVWARRDGAVAAPTASLHFDKPLLAALAERGIDFTHVTLHVGAGTFLPVKVDDVSDHKMHAEWGEITDDAAAEINATRAAGGRIIPVGTTALRLIESAAREHGSLDRWAGETDIFITPGYRFRITDALMTNFHLPRSTLMMLVSALMGRERIAAIYDHAIANEYRFFSYGDASLLIPEG